MCPDFFCFCYRAEDLLLAEREIWGVGEIRLHVSNNLLFMTSIVTNKGLFVRTVRKSE